MAHNKLHRTIQSGTLQVDILKRYEKWKDILAISGPGGLKLIKGFNDEPLQGEWKGYLSSRLNLQYRVIYKIDNETIFCLCR